MVCELFGLSDWVIDCLIMWQYIVVIFIGILVVIYLIRKMYSFLFKKDKKLSDCAGCGGCNFKDNKL